MIVLTVKLYKPSGWSGNCASSHYTPITPPSRL